MTRNRTYTTVPATPQMTIIYITSELMQSVEVLHQGSSKQELLVMEALFIADRKAPLNS